MILRSGDQAEQESSADMTRKEDQDEEHKVAEMILRSGDPQQSPQGQDLVRDSPPEDRDGPTILAVQDPVRLCGGAGVCCCWVHGLFGAGGLLGATGLAWCKSYGITTKQVHISKLVF
jgi:hypothetical protein